MLSWTMPLNIFSVSFFHWGILILTVMGTNLKNGPLEMNGYYIGNDIGGMWIKYQNQHGSSGWTTTDDGGVFRSRPVSFHMVRTQGYKSHMFGPNTVECGHVIILALLRVAGDERERRITTEFKCCHSLDSEGYWKMVGREEWSRSDVVGIQFCGHRLRKGKSPKKNNYF